VRPLADLQSSGQVGVCIELRMGDDAHPGEFASVRKVIEESPGDGPLLLRWTQSDGNGNGSKPPMLLSRSLGVTPNAGLLAELRTLLGRERVHLIRG